MRCPKCEAAGERHTVLAAGLEASKNGQPRIFWDEDNGLHSHNPNTIEERFRCSNGHQWVHRYQAACPERKCEWNANRLDETVWEIE